MSKVVQQEVVRLETAVCHRIKRGEKLSDADRETLLNRIRTVINS